MLCFCRGGDLVLQAGVRGTSWTQSPLEPRAFPGPQGPPDDAFSMEAVHCPGCRSLCQATRLSTSVISFNPPAFREAGPLVFLVLALRDTACNCWGCSQGPPPARLAQDHHHACYCLVMKGPQQMEKV